MHSTQRNLWEQALDAQAAAVELRTFQRCSGHVGQVHGNRLVSVSEVAGRFLGELEQARTTAVQGRNRHGEHVVNVVDRPERRLVPPA